MDAESRLSCVEPPDPGSPVSATRTQSTAASTYQPALDGLRALAVGAVIANHFNPQALPSGYLGVDVFFVLSGFVITNSLAHRQSKTFRAFLLDFYARRVRRLVPALLMFVAVTSLLLCLVNPDPTGSLETGIATEQPSRLNHPSAKPKIQTPDPKERTIGTPGSKTALLGCPKRHAEKTVIAPIHNRAQPDYLENTHKLTW